MVHTLEATTAPGLIVYRWGSGIVFFNAGHFKKRVMELIAGHPDIEWFILDGSTINFVDVTGAEMLESLAGELASSGVHFGLANVHRDVLNTLERTGVVERIGTDFVFATLNTAGDAFLARTQA